MNRQLEFVNEFDSLCINEILPERVFKYFFFSKEIVLFITDSTKQLYGILTLGDFIKGQENIQKAINRNYLYIKKNSLDEMFTKAQEIYDTYGIQSNIPILDENGRILGYVTDSNLVEKKKKASERKLREAIEKIEYYKKSFYLKKEIEAFYQVMENVKIYSKESEILRQFVSVFEGNLHIHYLSDEEYINEIKFLTQNKENLSDIDKTCLLFDFAPNNREVLYEVIGLAYVYNFEKFLSELTALVTNGEFSRILRITTNTSYRLKDFITDNSMKNIKIPSNKLLTKYVYDYMQQCGIYITVKDLRHTAAMEASCLINGIRGNERDVIPFSQCDLIEQQIKIARTLKKKNIHIFHLVGAVNVKLKESEKRRTKQLGNAASLINEKKLNDLQQLYGEDCEDRDILEYAREIEYYYPVKRRFENDLVIQEDCSSKYVNCENGIRKTYYQPEKYMNTIYCIGPCFALGLQVEDRHTIPSLLSKKMQKEGYLYRVVNLGTLTVANDAEELLERLFLIDGDIVINFYYTEKSEIQKGVIDASDAFNAIPDRPDMFFDKSVHCNRKGNEVYAKAIYENIKGVLKKDSRLPLKKNTIYDVFKTNRKEFLLYGLDQYFAMLEEEKKKIPQNAKSIGSIVMNCNPFTLGHRHLIEYASMHSEYLFIFLVEEDSSFFQYEDRMQMIQAGCEDMKNISILPSGKMIASDLTFPEYFQREIVRDEQIEKQKVILNTAADLPLFARYVVPTLGITVRFVAEEPLDALTKQYNEKMKKILTQFDIELVEIPRKTLDTGEVISASSVRRAYKSRQFEEMKVMLPPTTYNYLLQRQEKYLS